MTDVHALDAPHVPPHVLLCMLAVKLNCRAAWTMHLEAQELTKHHWAPKETTEGFILYSCISAFLVIMAGLMSGLTLGLMSLDSLDLEVSCMAWALPCCPAGCAQLLSRLLRSSTVCVCLACILRDCTAIPNQLHSDWEWLCSRQSHERVSGARSTPPVFVQVGQLKIYRWVFAKTATGNGCAAGCAAGCRMVLRLPWAAGLSSLPAKGRS